MAKNNGVITITYKMAGDRQSFKTLVNDADGIKKAFNGTMSSVNTLNGSLGKLTQAIGQGGSTIGGFGSILNAGTQIIGKYFGAISVGSVALKTVKDAFMRSESNVDLWEQTVQQAKTSYNVFLDTLNSGNWSNFFTNLTTAISGAKELYGALDRLGTVKSMNAAAISIRQQQLQELRHKKQTTTDKKELAWIDAQIKKTSDEIKALRMEAVGAGKHAGRATIATEIQNRYNAQGSGILARSSADKAANDLINNGSKALAKYQKILDDLTTKGTQREQKYVETKNGIRYTDNYTKAFFDMSHLNKEDQAMYKLAKAIVEGEEDIAKGIAIFDSAVQEGAAASKEQTRAYNSAKSGGSSSGGKSGKGGKGGKEDPWSFITIEPVKVDVGLRSISRVKEELAKAQKEFEDAGDSWGRAAAQKTIERLQKEIKQLEGDANPFAGIKIKVPEGLAVDTTTVDNSEKMKNALSGVASCLNSATGAMGAFDEKSQGAAVAAKAMSIAASIAALVGQFAAIPKGTEIWSWIAGTVAGAATLVTTIAQIRSATAFAEGGIVSGPTLALTGEYAGAVNNPEVIAPLNKLKGLIGGGNSDCGVVEFRIGERALVGVLERRNNKISRG